MVEQPKILKDDADATPEAGDGVLVEGRGVLAEYLDDAARRLQRQQHQPQQRRFAGARRPREKLKALSFNGEGEVADDLDPHAVSQADIFEAKQRPPLCGAIRFLKLDGGVA